MSSFLAELLAVSDAERIAKIDQLSSKITPEVEAALCALAEEDNCREEDRLAAVSCLIHGSILNRESNVTQAPTNADVGSGRISNWVEIFARHEKSQVRGFTAQVLGQIGVGGYSYLCDLLTDEVNTVRNLAERALIDQATALDQATIERLLLILRHPVPLIRSPAARLLGLSRVSVAVAPLTNMLLNDKQWLARLWAAKGLGDLGDLDAMPALIQALQHDEKNRVRAGCVEAIGKLRDNDSEKWLRSALQDEDGGVRKIASEQLSALGLQGETNEEDPFSIKQEE